MQNTIQKFRQSSIVFEKPGILSENLKILKSSNYPTVQYFLLKLCIRFPLTFLDLELFAKIKKTSGFYSLVFYTFINNS